MRITTFAPILLIFRIHSKLPFSFAKEKETKMKKRQLIILLTILYSTTGFCQNRVLISGKVTDVLTSKPLAYATIHLTNSTYSTLSKQDGSFRLVVESLVDSIEVSSIGYATTVLSIKDQAITNLKITLQPTITALEPVVVAIANKPGKSFMEKVIEHKAANNPSRFHSYSYQRYTRHELDLDNMDFSKTKGTGIKSLMLKSYSNFDSNAKEDKVLPIYFMEEISDIYHSTSPRIENENIIAKKTLGLKTDNLLSKLDKFHFSFNVYDDWIPIFDQTFASPLHSKAFYYYKYFEGASQISDEGDTLKEVRFVPVRAYEKAFTGTLWINTTNLAVASIDMHLTKTANLNFIQNIEYSQDYKQVYDSLTNLQIYMPYKFSSEIKFESGLDLIGIPVPENKESVKFIIRNTTVIDKLQFTNENPAALLSSIVQSKSTYNWNKSETFWQQHRLDSLTEHEKNIYRMVDSLKQDERFQRNVKLIAFAGTGYWEFGNYVGVGPYSSILSFNSVEGWRMRLGFWTMPGISKKISLFGYGAYGTKDKKFKGLLGMKYIWNEIKWTKTTLTYGSDYDFMVDQDDELDKDNLIHSMFRRNVPYTRMYVKQATLYHNQYLSPDFSANANLSFKELNPIFDFQYRPINPELDKPYDSIFAKRLPIAQTSIGIRYAHKEQTKILNYDNIKLGTFYPVLFANCTFGFESGQAQFEYSKINAGIEQRLKLPPKMMLYYHLEMGKVFGTIPYLLLHIPAGNEYYVASKYEFNTMTPYEFASDKYVSLHTRFYFGSTLFDKIPLFRKLGWRERISFNSYWGTMNKANIEYNKNSNFNLMGKTPFMEASIGIENIFHLLSIEYYRRLNYLNNPYAQKEGIYLGLTLVF